MTTTQKVSDIIKVIGDWNCAENNRISWNDYFMCMAYLASARSPCSRLHVGCVIVKNNRVVSMGYNGFVSGEQNKSFIIKSIDGKEHEMATVHAEQNSILYSASNGIAVNNSVAYVTHYPCLNCAKALESSGIHQVYYHEDYNNDYLVKEICTQLNITKI